MNDAKTCKDLIKVLITQAALGRCRPRLQPFPARPVELTHVVVHKEHVVQVATGSCQSLVADGWEAARQRQFLEEAGLALEAHSLPHHGPSEELRKAGGLQSAPHRELCTLRDDAKHQPSIAQHREARGEERGALAQLGGLVRLPLNQIARRRCEGPIKVEKDDGDIAHQQLQVSANRVRGAWRQYQPIRGGTARLRRQEA